MSGRTAWRRAERVERDGRSGDAGREGGEIVLVDVGVAVAIEAFAADGNAAVLLVAARLRHIAGTRWGTKMYMDVKRLENRKETAA